MITEITIFKEQLINAARRAYQIGLQTGNGGNLSCRIPETDTVLIKASGVSFGECSHDKFVMVDLQGEVVGEAGKPSRELLTHLCIYKKRPDISAIFHSHSSWSIAYAEDSPEIPLMTGHAKIKLGPLPVISEAGQATKDFTDRLKDLLTENPGLKAFVQKGHGIFSLGTDIIQAEHNAELVEETAQIAFLIGLKKALGSRQA
ncbi:MAG: class II aldolase/adducin family protein [Desulfofustis sp.]|nr:class II aldolase/adducin family protein [Desulfofustis sp.]